MLSSSDSTDEAVNYLKQTVFGMSKENSILSCLQHIQVTVWPRCTNFLACCTLMVLFDPVWAGVARQSQESGFCEKFNCEGKGKEPSKKPSSNS